MDRIHHKPQSVMEAKQQLRVSSAKIDYLAPVTTPIKQHPIKSVAGAFAAGVALNKISKNGLPPSLFTLLITAVSKL